MTPAIMQNLLYLAILVVGLIGWGLFQMWRWSKTADNNVRVLLAEHGGGGRFFLAPKGGGEVSITNPNNNTIRTWPINELATIDVPYPGVDFVPKFMQARIRLAIVNEGDWEPMLNRSPHRENIASPDVVSFLQSLSDANPDTELARQIGTLVNKIATGPTREMIASPAVLGNLLHEKITEAVLAVNKEIIDTLAGLVRKLDRIVSPTVFYICVGILLIVGVINIFVVNNLSGKITHIYGGVDRLQQSFGITIPPEEESSGGGFQLPQNPLVPRK